MTASRPIASRRWLGCLAIAWFAASRGAAAAPRAAAADPPVCTGDYAEDLSAM